MADTRILFVKVFRAEIEDLVEDIRHLEAILKSRFERLEIGDYVYRENSALLEKEVESLGEVLAWLVGQNPESYPDADSMKKAADGFVRGRVVAQEYPAAISVFLKRKAEKAWKYVESEREGV